MSSGRHGGCSCVGDGDSASVARSLQQRTWTAAAQSSRCRKNRHFSEAQNRLMDPIVATTMPDVHKALDHLDAVVAKDAAAMIRLVKPSLEPCLLPTIKMNGEKKKNILNRTVKLAQTNSSSKRKQRLERKKEEGEKMEVPSTYWSIMSYISYVFLVMVGYFREVIWGIGPIGEAVRPITLIMRYCDSFNHTRLQGARAPLGLHLIFT